VAAVEATAARALPGARFDVIICSHVLELVFERRAMLAAPAPPRVVGLIFGEVPMQVWKGIPIERDPVTQMHSFTRVNFKELFLRSGMGIVGSGELLGSDGRAQFAGHSRGWRQPGRTAATDGSPIPWPRPAGCSPQGSGRSCATWQIRRLPRGLEVLSRVRVWPPGRFA